MEMWWLGTENPSEQLRAKSWGSLGVKPKGREFWNAQSSDPPQYSSLLFQLGTQIPPLSPPSIPVFCSSLELMSHHSHLPQEHPENLRQTLVAERGNFRWTSNSCNVFGVSSQLGFPLLHPLLSSCLPSSFRSRQRSEDKQHHEIGGSPTPPAAANVAVPRWFTAASESCWYC